MILQSLVIIAFILIIISLGKALFHLVNHKTEEQSQKTFKSLTFRITLSIILFIFLFIAVATSLFKPHGLGSKIHLQKPVQVETTQ
ncbi:MAG: twin transmembrane helix small protein [Methylococcales bacterium]